MMTRKWDDSSAINNTGRYSGVTNFEAFSGSGSRVTQTSTGPSDNRYVASIATKSTMIQKSTPARPGPLLPQTRRDATTLCQELEDMIQAGGDFEEVFVRVVAECQPKDILSPNGSGGRSVQEPVRPSACIRKSQRTLPPPRPQS